MNKLPLLVLALALAATIGRASTPTEKLATVPARVHPWPAVFVTLQPAHLVFRNLAAEVVREVGPPSGPTGEPKVEWREPDSEPAAVTNVGATALRALRIELKFLAR